MEIYNRVIKRALCKLLHLHPDCFWDDLLLDVKWALRILANSTHGYTPFELVFKQPHLDSFLSWDCEGINTLLDEALDDLFSLAVSQWGTT